MPSNSNWQLVLASQSPRRKELLGRTGAKFQIQVSHVEEHSSAVDPRQYALDIALLKGQAVAQSVGEQNKIIISCDTVVALGDKIFGKPQDHNEARQFLQQLSGKTHQVHTALVIMVDGEMYQHVETTEVEFARITPYLLERYVATGDSLDKAGGYGIQGEALAFISSINGCYATVVGFPLAHFCDMMAGTVSKKLGWTQPWQNYFS